MLHLNRILLCPFFGIRHGGIGPSLVQFLNRISNQERQYSSEPRISQNLGTLLEQNMPACSTDMQCCLISIIFLIVAISDEHLSTEALAATSKQSVLWMRPHKEERPLSRRIEATASGKKVMFPDLLGGHGDHFRDYSTVKRIPIMCIETSSQHEELRERQDEAERKESRAPFEKLMRTRRGARRLRLRGGYGPMPDYPHNYTICEQEKKAAGGLPSRLC
jgi:hypothetical protein